MTITFEIPGKPFAKQRPKFSGKGKFVKTYTPKETVDAEANIAKIAAPLFKEPMQGAVKLRITAIFKPAKSWSKKRRSDAMERYHTQTPDLDNVVKLVSDALNGIAYADDSQVASLNCAKIWGEEARTIVTVTQL